LDIFRIVGHSLGGALATHAALSLANQKMPVSILYTYGSPRVGDQKFSEWYDYQINTSNKFRVTHGHDPVPHLPPHDFGFNHIPHEMFQ
jgi:predicted lipase